MNLLHYSQTFIGVLITLVVLCLFLSKQGNFIFALIQDKKEKYLISLQSKVDSLTAKVTEFKSSEPYAQVTRMVTNKIQLDPLSHRSAQLLYYKSHSDILGKQVRVTTSFSDPLAHLEKCTEQVLAPLYALAYGLGIFSLDEIASCFLSSSWQPIIVLYVNLITILSFVYWITIWTLYWFHSRQYRQSEKNNKILIYLDSNLGFRLGTLIKLIICFAIYALCMAFLPWHLMNVWGKGLISLVAFAAPILLIGIFRACYSNNKGRLSYLHALGHFCAIVVYSTGVIAIFNWMLPFTYDSVPKLVDIRIMRFSVVVFLLTIGILMPYLLPLWRHALIFKKESDRIDTTDSQIQDAIDDFNHQYDELCTDFGKNKIRQALENTDAKGTVSVPASRSSNNQNEGQSTFSSPDSLSDSSQFDSHITVISQHIQGGNIQAQSNYIHKYCKKHGLIDKETQIRSVLHNKGVFNLEEHRKIKQQRHK